MRFLMTCGVVGPFAARPKCMEAESTARYGGRERYGARERWQE